MAHQESTNGYPVNGVSTPITAADCNPHARIFSEAERHAHIPPPVPHAFCDDQCESELTSHGWTPCRCADRAVMAQGLIDSGFFTDCDPGDER